MCKIPSQQENEILPFFEGFKKFKRLKLFEPSVGVLGFFFVTVFMICCFFYLDYRAAAKGIMFSSQSERFMWFFRFGGTSDDRWIEFLTEQGDVCDVFDGGWVWDDSYPLYQSKDCSFMDSGFRCSENGRPDIFYTKWRWQPKHCNLPRFFPHLSAFFSFSCLIAEKI